MVHSHDLSDSWPPSGLDPQIEALQSEYFPDRQHTDLSGLVGDKRLGRLCLVSSFGAESAVLLHWLNARVPGIPVLFLDTAKHFSQTLAYRDMLVERLGLNLVVIEPKPDLVASEDPQGTLWSRNPDACCMIRKTMPLQDALAGYDSWVSGRKRFQGGRGALPILERDGNKIKVNPLALWQKQDIEDYMAGHALPAHPLVAQGFLSIGCEPCTRAVKPGEDERAGRWSHTPEKSECGIHLGPDGRFVRSRSGST